MRWTRKLAFVIGRVNQDMLLKIEYLLAGIAHRLGRKALEKVAAAAV